MKVLRIRDEEYRCSDVMPVGLMLDIAKAGDGGIAAVAAIGTVLDTLVVPEDRARLKAVLYRTEDPLDFEELSEAVGPLIAEYASRPTERPSRSPDGSTPIGTSSRVVSLSPVTDRVESASSTDGQSAVS
jgi:hypothetical protein